jgi:perosamine synthetase
MIKLFNTFISQESKNLVNDTLDSTYVSAGNKSLIFEEKLKLLIGNNTVVNSGTSALHLALETVGVRGYEVILPAQTFIASALAIIHAGGKPVFADINYMDGNIDPNSICSKITNKTKVIMPVHWGGYPCDMDMINEIAKKNNLIVIEDAAHAFGATYKNINIGKISNFTCFSFQAIKMLTTGDGGAISCTNIDELNKLKRIKWFGIDRDNHKPSILGERVYDLNEIGYKYHMNDIAASIGIGNLVSFNNILLKHEKICNIYNNNLKKVDGITLLNKKNDRKSSNWLYTFHVDDRINFIKKLKSENIECSVVHLGIDDNSIFGKKNMSLVNQRKFDSTQISIPIHSGLSDENIEKIIKTIKDGW